MLETNVEVKGHVKIEVVKGEEVVHVIEGHNVWTKTGRQFLAQLMSYAYTAGGVNDGTIREDRIAYIGFGTGANQENEDVTELQSPAAYTGTTFLKAITDTVLEVNNNDGYTGMTFSVEFLEAELVGEVLTEIGLFTDGDQDNDFALPFPSGANNINGAVAGFAPMAYKLIQPYEKTADYKYRVYWQVRFS